MTSKERNGDQRGGDTGSGRPASIAPAPPPIGTVRPIRDVPDIFVFRFELGPAILAQLLETLRRVPLQTLQEAIKTAKYPGFYHLYLDGEPKYVGKTARSIRARLREHASKLRGRLGLDLDHIGCRYAFVEDPSLIRLSEGELISFFAEHGLADWNASGFGSKVPGYRRGRQIASKWAEQYPPDHDYMVEAGAEERLPLYELAKQIAAGAPTTFSIPTQYRKAFRRDHAEPVSEPRREMPFLQWVQAFEAHLGAGWHIEKQAAGWYVVRG